MWASTNAGASLLVAREARSSLTDWRVVTTNVPLVNGQQLIASNGFDDSSEVASSSSVATDA